MSTGRPAHLKFMRLQRFRRQLPRKAAQAAALHPADAHPVWFGIVGVILGLAVAAIVRSGLEIVGWLAASGAESPFAGFVTAGVAGGAAGLTYTNLLYKRAESARGERAMHEETLRVAAELIDSEEELKFISGAKLLAGLIEMSPTHAQTAADILCARLRRRFDSSVDTDDLERYGDETIRRFEADRRMRNAVAESVASVTRGDRIAPHVAELRWGFTDVEFGTETSFDGCVFGDGTSFVRAKFGREVSFRRSWFLGGVRFEDVHASWGIDMRGCHAEVGLDIMGSQIGTMVDGSSLGLVLDDAELGWLTLAGIRSTGPILLAGVRVVGDIEVTDSAIGSFSLLGEQCDRALVMRRVTTAEDLRVRKLDVRKGALVTDCKIGGELELTEIRTDGSVVHAGNVYTSMKADTGA